MGVKNFFIKKMLQHKLKGMPADQQQKIMNAFEQNPELFEKMGQEIQALQKQGKNQQAAAMEVMRKYQSELQKLMM